MSSHWPNKKCILSSISQWSNVPMLMYVLERVQPYLIVKLITTRIRREYWGWGVPIIENSKYHVSNSFILRYSRTLSRVAIPLSPAQQTRGPTSTHTCLHGPTPLCQSPLRELGRGRRPWRARGACPTRAEPRPAWEMESSSYASCRLRWRGWRAGARTWRERQRRTNCQRRVSLGGGSEIKIHNE